MEITEAVAGILNSREELVKRINSVTEFLRGEAHTISDVFLILFGARSKAPLVAPDRRSRIDPGESGGSGGSELVSGNRTLSRES